MPRLAVLVASIVIATAEVSVAGAGRGASLSIRPLSLPRTATVGVEWHGTIAVRRGGRPFGGARPTLNAKG